MHIWYPREITDQWKAFFLEKLPGELVVEFDREAIDSNQFDVIVSGWVSEEHITGQSRLHSIVVPFAGVPAHSREILLRYPHIDVYNIHHNASSTAEMAMALLLSAAKVQIPRDRDFRANGWPARMWHDRSAILLEGKSALIVGYGEIGARIGRICVAMGMEVTGIRRSVSKGTEIGVRMATLSELKDILPQTNVLIICCPETEETVGMISREELKALKRPSIVINVGRGPIIDEEALFNALKDRTIDAAGLDVWWQYPKSGMTGDTSQRPSAYPIHELDNVVMSPHRGGLTSDDERLRLTHLAVLLTSLYNKKPISTRVDIQRGY